MEFRQSRTICAKHVYDRISNKNEIFKDFNQKFHLYSSPKELNHLVPISILQKNTKSKS